MNRNKTTDTNQSSELYELYELCKEVYKRTEWYIPNTEGFMNKHGLMGQPWVAPLYTSDYLLEKLPAHFYGGTIAMTAETDEGPTRYSFFYEDNYETAQVVHYKNVRLQGWDDTPLKALLKLTIALSEAGGLK